MYIYVAPAQVTTTSSPNNPVVVAEVCVQMVVVDRPSPGTVTSAPNFGYALAARKTPPESVGELSLKHVCILMDAAEPVRTP
eukprot:2329781-Pyramimonas_sp.AAC.1